MPESNTSGEDMNCGKDGCTREKGHTGRHKLKGAVRPRPEPEPEREPARNVVELEESHLDVWWARLLFDDKAAIFKAYLR
jgi:hypothetical protein